VALSRLSASVEAVRPDCTLAEAARLMIRDGVHAVIVTSEVGGPLLGIVTERDLVREVGSGADPASTPVEAFMTRAVTTLSQSASRSEITAKMRAHGIRHVPLVDGSGRVVRVVSLDEMVGELGRDLADLSTALRTEFVREVDRSTRSS
jgi:CBS domain-containing protein